MATKPKTPAKDDDTLASAARTSAQQIWQAGLGAFLKAQEEGGKVFSKLVREGSDLQQRKPGDAVNDGGGAAAEVSKQASGTWDKLEQVFEERVARALHKIGVPAQSEVDALTRRVDELSKLVAQLSTPAVAQPEKTRPLKTGARSAAMPATPPVTEPAAKPTLKPAAKLTRVSNQPRVAPAAAAVKTRAGKAATSAVKPAVVKAKRKNRPS